MAWKKALFLGGAVLLLAACSNATEPTLPSLQARDGGTPAAAKSPAAGTPSAPRVANTVNDVICSGYYVRSGDGECVTEELP